MIGCPAARRIAIEKITRGRDESPHANPAHAGLNDRCRERSLGDVVLG